MDAAALIETITIGETSRVQFKRELDNQDKIAAEMIAFSNSKGGVILFGIADKTGEIVGLDYAALQKAGNAVATIANDLVKPQVYITTEVVVVDTPNGRKNILVVNVGEGVSKPYKDRNGIIWVKQGADKRRVSDNSEIMRLFQQSGALFADEMKVFDTSIDDLDEHLFADYFRKEFKMSYQEKGLTYEAALRAKRILRDGQITLAGLLFFGNEPQNIRPAFTIKTVSFFGNDIAGNAYRSKPEDLKGTIPELFKQGMMFLKSGLQHLQQGQGFNSVGILEISEIALMETLQNALIHRDYFKNAPVRVLIFDDRVEIISPGKLPDGLTVEEIKYGNTAIRNHQIAMFAVHTLPYSGLGSGLKRALQEQPDMQFINNENGEEFTVRFLRKGVASSGGRIKVSAPVDVVSEPVGYYHLSSKVTRLGGNIKASEPVGEELVNQLRGVSEPVEGVSEPVGEELVNQLDDNTAPVPNDLLHQLPEKYIDLLPLFSGRVKEKSELDDFICSLCGVRSFSLAELALLLNKRKKYLLFNFLTPLCQQGKLQRLYPDKPNHPKQKYRAAV